MAKKVDDSRAKRVYNSIIEYITIRGYAPTQDELSQITCLSKQAVHNSVIYLENEGFIIRERRKPRAIHIVGYGFTKLP